jgi:hypothetical protein
LSLEQAKILTTAVYDRVAVDGVRPASLAARRRPG